MLLFDRRFVLCQEESGGDRKIEQEDSIEASLYHNRVFIAIAFLMSSHLSSTTLHRKSV
jgi:hypothetical protein